MRSSDSLIGNINYLLIANFIALSLVGFLVHYSSAGGHFKPFLLHQILVYFLLGIPIIAVIALSDLDIFRKYAYHLVILTITLLLAVHLIGKTAMGATRWINVMGINIQPGEILKISLIIALAKYFSTLNEGDSRNKILLFSPALLVMLPLYLISKQPSLGTCAIILLIIFSIYFVIGTELKYFLILSLGVMSISPLIWKYALHDYQKNRILAFVNFSENKKYSSYNIEQSKIAIGSGGIFGKGLLKGSQTQLQFLPEKHTDFALSVFAEEFGFFGVTVVIFLYTVFCIHGIVISSKSKDVFLKLLATGISLFFFYHFFINVGMISGLLPVVGMPLLMISYGGSAIVSCAISMGLLLRIDIENKRSMQII